MVVAMIAFFVSLVLIVGLFFLKHRENTSARIFVPVIREKADEQALRLKSALIDGRERLEKVPPMMALISRFLVHEFALGTAASARFLERQAHRLADLVSHKHGFERRETKSDFLKQVTEYKSSVAEGTGEEKIKELEK